MPDRPFDHLWRKGPRVRVELLEVGWHPEGIFVQAPGETHEMYECNATHLGAYKKARILTPISAAGREYMAAASAALAGRKPFPSYEELVLKRMRAIPATPPADLGPMLEAEAVVPGNFGGKPRKKGRVFKAPEGALAPPFIDGAVLIIGKPSPRFDEFVRKIEAFKRSPLACVPYPSY